MLAPASESLPLAGSRYCALSRGVYVLPEIIEPHSHSRELQK